MVTCQAGQTKEPGGPYKFSSTLPKRENNRKVEDEHLNGIQAEDQDDDGSDYVGAVNNEDVPSPTIGEVRNTIKQLKNNKSTGKDGIRAILIKMGSEKLVSYLHRLIVRIWETEQQPQEWKDGVICPIF
ncbi:uncharacterized protein LOC129774044 [Toxorhynchites rutilus septentrionalis]|uniref:uncharacterized protein LOC129774044 n=1 Tax=Toxorhynchites rutilus septentrionalis TaxID=329112 RepID=UPI00247A3803|nr:uncharacterized protein LOC129774044 [Toxorhynchites rutilus septentrionalis]